jgi:hypothetical protein
MISGALSEYDISLFSTDGFLEQNYKLLGQEKQIDLSSFSSGVYLIRLTHKSSGRVTTKKIVKY